MQRAQTASSFRHHDHHQAPSPSPLHRSQTANAATQSPSSHHRRPPTAPTALHYAPIKPSRHNLASPKSLTRRQPPTLLLPRTRARIKQHLLPILPLIRIRIRIRISIEQFARIRARNALARLALQFRVARLCILLLRLLALLALLDEVCDENGGHCLPCLRLVARTRETCEAVSGWGGVESVRGGVR
ncbi:hypothetical protein BDY17DRAFT_110741 [Neohortaea acidophila]|uniref:Uncharacterized protein n=1 Tax=Neohortaea acidophila TaxID=245834 RepID=A0A6A6Q136_9PEZI|nr:uncharacterized protein BDY17DRAFT_110741 [Neohortaea acidophila]KAF2485731.1 hypothetical protein BDY17DRAFT_110741 [Neohortaea acidophila]